MNEMKLDINRKSVENFEKFNKYAWVDFYQDYILPTNTSSKNIVYKKIFRYKAWMIIDCKHLRYHLEKRKNVWKYYIWIHITWAMIMSYLTMLCYLNNNTSNKRIITILVINVLINIYPILVQLRTNYRITNILKK